jgi:hypothetical protein
MFPVLAVDVSGLEPDAHYVIVMEMCLSSSRRYKFVGAEWKPTGKAEPQLAPSMRRFIHQDSPATGAHWMREPIRMKAAKLTNNPVNNNGHVSASGAWAGLLHTLPLALSCHETTLFANEEQQQSPSFANSCSTSQAVPTFCAARSFNAVLTRGCRWTLP